MTKSLLLTLFSLAFLTQLSAQQAVGSWKDHLPYSEVNTIEKVGNLIYCATPFAIFTYDEQSGEVQRLSKVNGLSDIDISSMAYSDELNLVVVGYANGNIDLIDRNGITNIADIKRSGIIGDKSINEIFFEADRAWLATGFGIVLLNLVDQEISDTYIIGPEASNLKVNGVVKLGSTVYAATETGLLYGEINSNLADFANWSSEPGLQSSVLGFDLLRIFNNELVLLNLTDRKLYTRSNVGWSEVPGSTSNFHRDLQVSEGKLIQTTRYNTRVMDSLFEEVESYGEYSFSDEESMVTSVILDGQLWHGDGFLGLIKRKPSGEDLSIFPEGPFSEKSWKMDAVAGQVWVAHGELKTNWDNNWNNDASSGLIDGGWLRLKGREELVADTIRDHVNVRVDPRNPNHVVFATWFKGLVDFDRSVDELSVLNAQIGTAPIAESNQNDFRYQVAGIEYDPNGNMWVSNSYSDEPLKVLDTQGEWHSFACPGVIGGNDLFGEMVIGEDGNVWTIMPRGNGLLVFSPSGTFSSTGDDNCNKLSTVIGDGALPTTSIYSIAIDKDGEVWIGTSEGPAVNYNPAAIFSNNPSDFQQILVEQDGNVEVLLGDQIITTIAIDGANRKWFGTQGGGAFLMSEDGGEQILRFTSDNSPLLSNEIRDIVIEPESGEVFFATLEGIVSYKGDATESSIANSCLSVFPNPVRENYTGLITIDGLFSESEVKITDIAGNVVFQTTSNGGRATWSGADFSGSRVSTGVYFAHSVSRDGETGCTAKILLIN